MQSLADRQRTILVAGATGFIGRHLVARLDHQGHRVIGLGRGRSDPAGIIPADRWFCTRELSDLPPIIPGLDAAVNCAVCYGRNSESWGEIAEVNAALPMRLTELCLRSGCPTFIQLDTFSWKPRTGVFVRSAYTLTKRLAWELLSDFASAQCAVSIARLEFPYGPGDRPHKFVSQLTKALVLNAPEFKLSDGEQRRDFVWVGDVCDALIAMIMDPPTSSFREFEIGTGRPVGVREFAEVLKDCLGSTTELRFGAVPRIPGEMSESFADVSALARIAKVPSISVLEGCRRLATALREFRSNDVGGRSCGS